MEKTTMQRNEAQPMTLAEAFAQLLPKTIYTHRNGETDTLSVVGYYWFDGVINAQIPTDGIEIVSFRGDDVSIMGDNGGYYPHTCVGKWRGPIEGPANA